MDSMLALHQKKSACVSNFINNMEDGAKVRMEAIFSTLHVTLVQRRIRSGVFLVFTFQGMSLSKHKMCVDE